MTPEEFKAQLQAVMDECYENAATTAEALGRHIVREMGVGATVQAQELVDGIAKALRQLKGAL